MSLLVYLACAMAGASATAAELQGRSAAPEQHPTIDILSVVKVNSRAVRDARSAATLGENREGTGIVIDANGLVLTIGYLITEAERVELSTADGRDRAKQEIIKAVNEETRHTVVLEVYFPSFAIQQQPTT